MNRMCMSAWLANILSLLSLAIREKLAWHTCCDKKLSKIILSPLSHIARRVASRRISGFAAHDGARIIFCDAQRRELVNANVETTAALGACDFVRIACTCYLSFEFKKVNNNLKDDYAFIMSKRVALIWFVKCVYFALSAPRAGTQCSIVNSFVLFCSICTPFSPPFRRKGPLSHGMSLVHLRLQLHSARLKNNKKSISYTSRTRVFREHFKFLLSLRDNLNQVSSIGDNFWKRIK